MGVMQQSSSLNSASTSSMATSVAFCFFKIKTIIFNALALLFLVLSLISSSWFGTNDTYFGLWRICSLFPHVLAKGLSVFSSKSHLLYPLLTNSDSSLSSSVKCHFLSDTFFPFHMWTFSTLIILIICAFCLCLTLSFQCIVAVHTHKYKEEKSPKFSKHVNLVLALLLIVSLLMPILLIALPIRVNHDIHIFSLSSGGESRKYSWKICWAYAACVASLFNVLATIAFVYIEKRRTYFSILYTHKYASNQSSICTQQKSLPSKV